MEKELAKEVGGKILDLAKESITTTLPNIGIYAAGVEGAKAMIEATAGLPPAQRAIFGGLGSFTTVLASKIAMESATALVNNAKASNSMVKDIKEENNPSSESTQKPTQETTTIPSPDSTEIPSPQDTNFTINSPLEEMEVPLLSLLDSIISLNILELVLIILIIVIYNNNTVRNFMLKKFQNLIPQKYVRIHKFYNKISSTSEKFYKILTYYFIFLLIVVKLINLFFITGLTINIDDFIMVYNNLKKK